MAYLATTPYGSYSLREWEESNRTAFIRGMLTGDDIPGSTTNFFHLITMQGVKLTRISPNVDGPGNIRRRVEFEAFYPDPTYQTAGVGQPNELVWSIFNNRSIFGVRV
jgi:hypothetical protein